MSGVHYGKEAVIRAANMYILRKVVDTMNQRLVQCVCIMK